MNSKIITIILVVLILLGAAGIVIILFATHNGPANSKTIQTSQGPLNVQDYTQHPVQTTNDLIVLAQSNEYQISNFKTDSSFLITLLSKPLSQARVDAQNTLLKDLNITQAQACTINISVKVPNDVDSTFSGHDLGLSFCPNSITLP